MATINADMCYSEDEYEAQLKEDLEEYEKERMSGIEMWRK